MNHQARCVALVLGIWMASASANLMAQVVLVEKLRSGDEAPGLNAEVSILALAAVGVDRSGNAIVVGQVRGRGINASNDRCVWRETAEGFELVVCTGDLAPGLQTPARFAEIRDVKVASNGAVFFRSRLIGPAVSESNNEGFWYADRGDIRLMARKGDSAIGVPDEYVLSELNQFRANSNAMMVFEAIARDPRLPEEPMDGVFVSSGDQASAILSPGSTTTLFGEEAIILDQSDPYITDGDVINFRTRAREVDSGNGRAGIVTRREQEFVLNHEAGGVIDLGKRDRFYSTIESNLLLRSLASNGRLTFTNTAFSASDQSEPEEIVVLQETPDGLREVFAIPFLRQAIEGRQLISLTFPESNANGEAVFLGFSDRSETPFVESEPSVWFAGPSGVKRLADVGQHAVGFDPAHVYSDFDFPAINRRGQALFSGEAVDPDNPFRRERAIWATDFAGQVHLVVATGQLIDVADDLRLSDLRMVASVARVARGNGEDGDGIPFGHEGSIPLTVGFEDGTTIVYTAELQPGCNPQDLALPYGELDFFDLLIALPAVQTEEELDAFQDGLDEGCRD